MSDPIVPRRANHGGVRRETVRARQSRVARMRHGGLAEGPAGVGCAAGGRVASRSGEFGPVDVRRRPRPAVAAVTALGRPSGVPEEGCAAWNRIRAFEWLPDRPAPTVCAGATQGRAPESRSVAVRGSGRGEADDVATRSGVTSGWDGADRPTWTDGVMDRSNSSYAIRVVARPARRAYCPGRQAGTGARVPPDNAALRHVCRRFRPCRASLRPDPLGSARYATRPVRPRLTPQNLP